MGVAATMSQKMFSDRLEVRAVGFTLCGVVVLANAVGSVLGERLLKGEIGTPLACMKARLVLAELFLVTIVLNFVEAPSRGCSWFDGWNWRVAICAAGWVPATWCSTLITARFSTVVKNLVQCLSTMITYILSLMDPTNTVHPPAATLLALIVLFSVSTFSLQSAPSRRCDSRDDCQDCNSSVGQDYFRQRALTEPGSSSIATRRLSLKRSDTAMTSVASILDLVSYLDVRRVESDPVLPVSPMEDNFLDDFTRALTD